MHQEARQRSVWGRGRPRRVDDLGDIFELPCLVVTSGVGEVLQWEAGHCGVVDTQQLCLARARGADRKALFQLSQTNIQLSKLGACEVP